MNLWQIQNLLPKRVADGVALKTFLSQHLLSRFPNGLRKQSKKFLFNRLSKLAGLFLISLYLTGYHPVATLPPIQKSTVLAETFSQEQIIEAVSFSEPFVIPHPGYISSRFTPWHPGLDIATGLGMPIHPINKGIVAEIIRGWLGLGHYVVVDHEHNLRSTYGHMGQIYVRKGDSVTTSSILGTVGMTGRTTGPHTHLEITLNGQFINPEKILPDLPDWPKWEKSAPHGQNIAGPKATVAPTVTPTPIPVSKETKNKALLIDLRFLEERGEKTTNKEIKLPLLQWSQLGQP